LAAGHGRSAVAAIPAVVVIVVKRDTVVVALDEASAGRVVLGGGQGQSRVLRKRIDGLHQALAEGGFTHNQAAVVVLNGACDDLGRRCGSAVHQHNQRVVLATVAVGRAVHLLG